MKSARITLVGSLTLLVLSTTFAQDGDHLTTNGAGQSFLAPDALVPGGIGINPFNVTIGTAATGGASLRVRGDQLPVNDTFLAGYRCTFRTDVGNSVSQNWSMTRNNVQQGRLYHGANFNWFAVQAPQPFGDGLTPGILWLENAEQDGIMLRANGLQLAAVNGYPLRTHGFVSVGHRALTSGIGMQNMPSRARLHMVDLDGGASEPWRPYYRNGVLFTGNSDMAYVGHRYHDEGEGTTPWTYTGDRSDLLISAGENNMEDPLRQRIRFTYTTTPVPGTTTGAASYGGLEFMQLWPESATEGFLGLGDFTATGLPPTQRLDILNGKIRVRDLPSDPTSGSNELVTVNMTTGVLEHRPAAALPDNCEWDMNPGTYDIYTAYGTSTTCPDESSKVTIGSNVPGNAKFTVVSDYALGSTYDVILAHATVASPTTGVLAAVKGIVDPGAGGQTGVLHMGTAGYATDASQTNYGVFGKAMGDPSSRNAGVNGEATGAGKNIGVRGYGYAGSDSRGVEGTGAGSDCNGSAYGVHGKAVGAKYNYGVYGYADPEFCGSDTANRFYAGYFAGNVFGAGGLLTPSDEMLKQDIMELQGGLSVVMNLRPKTYSYRTQEFPRMGLPTGPQAGLLAQEMEEVLPGLVQQVHHPRSMDSTGQVVAEGVDFKGLKMEGVIPYLIQAIQEQQATIDHLSQRLDEQAQQLANCCEAGAGEVRSDAPAPAIHSSEQIGGNERQLRIQPNPFNERTVVSYELEQGGRMQLMANSADGKQLNVLEEAQRETGAYQYEWNTSGLAPGVYYVTLLLDGQPLVKKAVKVAR